MIAEFDIFEKLTQSNVVVILAVIIGYIMGRFGD